MDNEAISVALDAEGAATIAGYTESTDIPITPGAYDSENEFAKAASFVSRLDMLPNGVTKFGQSTPGPAGPIAIGVTAIPAVGSTTFGLTSTNGPPIAPGFLVFALGKLADPVGAAGADLWLDPATLFAVLAQTSNGVGHSELRIEIPSVVPAGFTWHSQYVWKQPGPSSGYAASNALEIVVQP
ncbi:MAG: hypothetical protein FD129_3233 [bacterium]|nr:MAG: hypothetical protein FD129_3233 [bacterium]